MKNRKLTREVRVGLMTVTAIFILYFGLNFLKGVDVFSPVSYYYGSFNHIDGLVPSAPVYIKGHKVGQVENVHYDFHASPAFNIKISVNKDILVPENTTMELFDDGLMGGKAIQLLFPVTVGAEFAQTKSGDTLNTVVANGLLSRLTEELVPKIEHIAMQTDSLLTSIRLVIDGNSFQNSLLSIERTTSDLAVSAAALKQMTQRDMPDILTDISQITSDVKVLSGNMKNIDLASSIDNIDITIKNLQDISSKINNSEGTLGLLLHDQSLYNDIVTTVHSADKLLIDLQEHPKRYVHFSIFGTK